MFEEAQKISQPKKDASASSDFVVHVMPKAFKEKNIIAKEEKKPAPIVLPKPVAKVEVPKPAVQMKPKAIAPVKKHSKIPWILGIVGLILVSTISVVGYFAISNMNKKQDIVIEDPVEDPVIVIEPVVEEIRPGKDIDSDGLTDIEETMYGTNPRDPDTDRDTFLDGNEVFHRYSPLGVSPQTLLDTGAVKQYLSADGFYELTYPSQWTVAGMVNSDFDSTGEVIFRTNSTATIRLTISALGEQDFESWYKQEESDRASFGYLETTLTKEGYIAYQSSDERIAYVIANNQVFTFWYDLADEKEIVYMQTFQMMINSFTIMP